MLRVECPCPLWLYEGVHVPQFLSVFAAPDGNSDCQRQRGYTYSPILTCSSDGFVVGLLLLFTHSQIGLRAGLNFVIQRDL